MLSLLYFHCRYCTGFSWVDYLRTSSKSDRKKAMENNTNHCKYRLEAYAFFVASFDAKYAIIQE